MAWFTCSMSSADSRIRLSSDGCGASLLSNGMTIPNSYPSLLDSEISINELPVSWKSDAMPRKKTIREAKVAECVVLFAKAGHSCKRGGPEDRF
jgi:hypothetical protein